MQAATTGAVNFALADPFDSWWWKRTSWVLTELLRQRNLQYLGHELSLCLSQLSNPLFCKDGGIDAISEKCYGHLEKLHAATFPWTAGTDTKQAAKETASRMEEQWLEIFGEAGLSEAAIDAQIEAMYAQDKPEQDA